MLTTKKSCRVINYKIREGYTDINKEKLLQDNWKSVIDIMGTKVLYLADILQKCKIFPEISPVIRKAFKKQQRVRVYFE